MADSAFQSRLANLRNRGFIAREVLDIGAYKGWFAEVVRSVFPESRLHLFEANEAHADALTQLAQRLGRCDVHLAVLSSESAQAVDFYTLDERLGVPSTGSSIYRENTAFYAHPIIVKKHTSTLDDWFQEHQPAADDWREHGLVKLDVQGAELAVLRGARRFLSTCQPRYYLVETSIQPYNAGAPLIDEVFAYFRPFARMVDVWGLNYDAHGALLQMDVLFERTGSET